jgi:hypothetical protein
MGNLSVNAIIKKGGAKKDKDTGAYPQVIIFENRNILYYFHIKEDIYTDDGQQQAFNIDIEPGEAAKAIVVV